MHFMFDKGPEVPLVLGVMMCHEANSIITGIIITSPRPGDGVMAYAQR